MRAGKFISIRRNLIELIGPVDVRWSDALVYDGQTVGWTDREFRKNSEKFDSEIRSFRPRSGWRAHKTTSNWPAFVVL